MYRESYKISMKNLNYKQLLALVDDILYGHWEGDTSKPIMIWFWSNSDLDTVKKHLGSIRELASFQKHPIRHSPNMILGDKIVKVADHPEYAKSFCLPSSFNDYTKGFLYHQYLQQLDPEYLYDCRELIQNTHLPLIGLVNDYEKESCEKKGITVDMDSFVNYRYIGKTMHDWLEEATGKDQYGLPRLPPCITDFVSDEQFKDLFFYRDWEPDSIDSDKRLFSPESWYIVMNLLWDSYVDYHKDLFAYKYNNVIDFLNSEHGLGLPAEAADKEIKSRVDTIPNGLRRQLAKEIVRWFRFGLKKPSQVSQDVVYSDLEDFLISGNAEYLICGQTPLNEFRDFYGRWIEWLKNRQK